MLPSSDYSKLDVTFYVTYPKSTPKKHLIDQQPQRKKPDVDNYVKGLSDAMEQAGILVNDGQLSDISCRKRYTLEPEGYIEFCLH